jgi:hypothetical protein
MHYEEAVQRMTALVYPYVKRTLTEDAQTADIGAIAEAIQTIGLSSSQVTPDELVPDSAEIQDYSIETGRLIINAWWQFLSFLLDRQPPKISLDGDLLPVIQAPDVVSQELWDAFNSCIASCPFNQEDLRPVFHQFAQSLGPQENIQFHQLQIVRDQGQFVAHS